VGLAAINPGMPSDSNPRRNANGCALDSPRPGSRLLLALLALPLVIGTLDVVSAQGAALASGPSPHPGVTFPLSPIPFPHPPIPSSFPEITPDNAAALGEAARIEYGPWDLVLALAWSSMGDRLAIAAGEHVYLYQMGGQPAGQEPTVDIHAGVWVTSLAFNPDGEALAAAGRDGLVRLWEVSNGDLLLSLPGHNKGASSVAFSPDGKLLASGGNDALARLWEAGSGTARGHMIGGTYAVPAVAFHPDGSSLAVVNGEVIRLRDVQTGRFVSTLRGSASIYTLAFSPFGHLLATGDTANQVQLWDVKNASLLTTLSSHAGEPGRPSALVWQVAFSPDGRLLASAGGDGTVRLWEVESGHLLATLTVGKLAVTCLAFSPDGTLLASGGLDANVRLWAVGDS